MINKKCSLNLVCLATLLLGLAAGEVTAQAMESVEPFKVGTFAIDDAPTVGLVLRDDQLVVDLVAANRALELEPQYPGMPMPADMLGLIEQYEYGLKFRIYEVVNWLVEEDLLRNDNLPAWIHPVGSVDIMAPIQYPGKIMNAAVNFYTHACEGCNADELQARRKRVENLHCIHTRRDLRLQKLRHRDRELLHQRIEQRTVLVEEPHRLRKPL